MNFDIEKKIFYYLFPNNIHINDNNILIKLIEKYKNEFDYHFYINFYKDLKYKNYNQALRHWILYGKKEGRICNKFKSYLHLINYKLIIKNYDNIIFKKINQEKINILIRTCNREKYFKKCINSVLNQNYNNYEIFISYDNILCEKYLKNFKNKFYINKNNYIHKDYCYNDYLNILHNKVNNGYIIYLDDDDKFVHNNCLKLLNENLINENTILIYKFLRADKCIYPKNIYNIQLGEISTENFCFHSKFKNNKKWLQKKCSDYFFFKDLIKTYNFNIKFCNLILSETIYSNKIGNFGL